MEEYYYNQLNKTGREAYHAILTGLKSLAPSFRIPLLENKELTEIYFSVRMDHPEIFYTVEFKYRYHNGAEYGEMMPVYLSDRKKIPAQQQAMRSRIEKLVRQAAEAKEVSFGSPRGRNAGAAGHWSGGGHGGKGKQGQIRNEKEIAKLLFIHDFICGNVRYDKLKKPYSHEITGPLEQGIGVCEGIAKTFKILCDALGIWCVMALSDNNLDKKIKYRHTWNIVRIGGQYYHIDSTFDNTLGKPDSIRYDYFMLSDKQLFRDHEPVIYRMPACPDGDRFYYKAAGLSLTKTEDVRKKAAQAAKKGKEMTFHWRGGYLTREVLAELLAIIEEEAEKKERHARLSINRPQAVLRISFEKVIPAEQIVMEEANEGEKN